MSRQSRFTEHFDLEMPSLPAGHPILRRTAGSNEPSEVPKPLLCPSPGNPSFLEEDPLVCPTPVEHIRFAANPPRPAVRSSPPPMGPHLRSRSLPPKLRGGKKVVKVLVRGSELLSNLVKGKNGKTTRLGDRVAASELTDEPESYVGEVNTDRPQQSTASLPDAGFRRGRTRSRVTAHLKAVRQGSEEPKSHRERRRTGDPRTDSERRELTRIAAELDPLLPQPAFLNGPFEAVQRAIRPVSHASSTGASSSSSQAKFPLNDRPIVLPSIRHRIHSGYLPHTLNTLIPSFGDLSTSEWEFQQGVLNHPASSSGSATWSFPKADYTLASNPFSASKGSAKESAVEFGPGEGSQRGMPDTFPGDDTDMEIVDFYRCPHQKCAYPLFHGHALGLRHSMLKFRYLEHLRKGEEREAGSGAERGKGRRKMTLDS